MSSVTWPHNGHLHSLKLHAIHGPRAVAILRWQIDDPTGMVVQEPEIWVCKIDDLRTAVDELTIRTRQGVQLSSGAVVASSGGRYPTNLDLMSMTDDDIAAVARIRSETGQYALLGQAFVDKGKGYEDVPGRTTLHLHWSLAKQAADLATFFTQIVGLHDIGR